MAGKNLYALEDAPKISLVTTELKRNYMDSLIDPFVGIHVNVKKENVYFT